MDYEGYATVELVPKLPNHKGEVYVLLFDDGLSSKEFYVGQTSRFLGRMDDYFWAESAAATDFKVGIAIRYFSQKLGGRVFAKHKAVDDPRAEEKRILELLRGHPLLNDQGLWYDYKTSNLIEVEDRIVSKCNEIVAFTGRSETR